MTLTGLRDFLCFAALMAVIVVAFAGLPAWPVDL